METWEAPAQEVLGNAVSRVGGTVLEIGYGLGMAGKAIQVKRPLRHVMVEAHPAICAMARSQWAGHPGVEIREGFWQDESRHLKSHAYDGIVFDAYPMDGPVFDGSAAETLLHISEFLPTAFELLAPDGVLAFLDFSCGVFESPTLGKVTKPWFSHVECEEVPVAVPSTCSYAAGSRAHVIRVMV